MTILGVLGEAAKLSDEERRVVIAGVVEAAGVLPVCVGVSHAATDRAVAFAREARAMGAHSVMLAPPALARPNDPAVLAHYLAVADAIDLPIVVQDHPASSGVHMTRRTAGHDRRAGAVVPRRQARGRAESAQGRTAARRRARRQDPGWPRRDHAARGAPPRRRRDHDRLRVPRAPRGDRAAATGPATRPAPATRSIGSCRSSGSRTSRA